MVNLDGADLTEARLSDATLTGANLRGANLSSATLGGVNLTGANLLDTGFPEDYLDTLIFCNTTMPEGEINNSGC